MAGVRGPDRRRTARRRRWWPGVDRIRLTVRHWAVLSGFTATALIVAVGLGWPSSVERPRLDPDRVAAARAALAGLEAVERRPARDSSYRREAFGQAWTDHAGVAGSGNACDTRNDILSRDLAVSKSVAAQSCSDAVAAGRFRSPYTGREVVFTRGRASAQVQIDHVVPLAYAWDMGAARWPAKLRIAFANDPANLIAVDAASNQAKSDLEPGRWMPELRGFWCQYAAAFVTVSAAYRLRIDRPSRDVLAGALADC